MSLARRFFLFCNFSRSSVGRLSISHGWSTGRMKKFFERLCLICFCVVVFVIAVGIAEAMYFPEQGAVFLDCRIGSKFFFDCNDGPLKLAKELILNMPPAFILAPIAVWGLAKTWPLFALAVIINLTLLLATIYLFLVLGRGTRRLFRY
jgi:hypothetical protein